MVTVTCQYTGIEFEASSKRSKNHPAVSDLLNEAAKDKYNPAAYRTVKDALADAKAAGMTDINEIVSYARDRMNNANDAAWQRRIEDEQQRKARAERNSLLKSHGYRWHKEDEESMDFAGAGAFESMYGSANAVWILTAPDNREVTVAQALKEIENA